MTDRPTPETDELGYIPTDIGHCWPLVEHAKRLERERDEAREELLRIKTLQLNEDDLICTCGRHQPCRHC